MTLLLSAIIGCWYAYQQNKSAKRHLRRMAKDMEGLQKAENALADMQKVVELTRCQIVFLETTPEAPKFCVNKILQEVN